MKHRLMSTSSAWTMKKFFLNPKRLFFRFEMKKICCFSNLMALLQIYKTASQVFSVTDCIYEGNTVTLRCTTNDLRRYIRFHNSGVNKGGCFYGIGCITGIAGYQTPTQSTGIYTDMTIPSYNSTRDDGFWVCTYGETSSAPVHLVPENCSGMQFSASAAFAVQGEDFVFTCSNPRNLVSFSIRKGSTVSLQCVLTLHTNSSCSRSVTCKSSFMYGCDSAANTYKLTIPESYQNDSYHNTEWFCQYPFEGAPSNSIILNIKNPIRQVSILPTSFNKSIYIEVVGTQTFTCTTDPGRPAAWIQWYIGSDNVTDQATPKSPQPVNDGKLIASSTLVYTGRDTDHNKVVHCEAANVEGRLNIKSENVIISILLPISAVTITTEGKHDPISVVADKQKMFTCITDSGRPAAWIQWYIGSDNVTDQATPQTPQPDGNKFISSSTLVYTGRDADHNKVVYCEAVNVDGGQKITSTRKTINILVAITAVTISSPTNAKSVRLMKGDTVNITCTTDLGRPPAVIQWFIGRTNMTRESSYQVTLVNGNKYVTQSFLSYIGNEENGGQDVYCVAGNIEEMKNIQSNKLKMEILCCEICNTGTDAKSFLSYVEGMGIGVGGIIFLEGTLLLVICCMKKIRKKSKEKQSEHYEKPDKTRSKPNPYNELGEINLESMTKSNYIETITTYEEIR